MRETGKKHPNFLTCPFPIRISKVVWVGETLLQRIKFYCTDGFFFSFTIQGKLKSLPHFILFHSCVMRMLKNPFFGVKKYKFEHLCGIQELSFKIFFFHIYMVSNWWKEWRSSRIKIHFQFGGENGGWQRIDKIHNFFYSYLFIFSIQDLERPAVNHCLFWSYLFFFIHKSFSGKFLPKNNTHFTLTNLKILFHHRNIISSETGFKGVGVSFWCIVYV